VQSLRNDFDTVVPSLVRLVAVEKDMKSLVAQLQTLNDANAPAMPAAPLPSVSAPLPPVTPPVVTPPPAPVPAPVKAPAKKEAAKAPAKVAPKDTPVKAASATTPAAPIAPVAPLSTNAAPPAKSGATTLPAGDAKASSTVSPEAAPAGNKSPEGAASLSSQPAPVAPVAAAKPAAAAAAPGSVKALSADEHGGMTYLMIDMSAKSAYTLLLLNGNKQLVVDLPNVSWGAKPTGPLKGSSLATTYKYGQGKLVLDLTGPAAIASEQVMALAGTAGYRLVIGLRKAP
jgi:hypothetical protein